MTFLRIPIVMGAILLAVAGLGQNQPEEREWCWLTWARWDDLHRNVSADITSRINTFDRFFGEERIEEEGKGCQVRLALGSKYSQFDELSIASRLRLRLQLPILERQFQLVVDNDVEPETVQRDGSNAIVLDTKESRPDAALRTDLIEQKHFRLSADAGLKTGAALQPFVKLRGRYILHTNPCELRLTQSVQYYSTEQFRETTEAKVSKEFGDGWLISQSAQVDYKEHVNGYVPSITSQLLKDHGSRSASKLEFSAGWPQMNPHNPDDQDWDYYQGRYTYRRLLHAPWLFVETFGGIKYSEEHHYEKDPFVGFFIEVVLGDLK